MPLPARTAALPRFVPAAFDDATPGHRFQMYFRYWQADSFKPYKKVAVDRRLERDAKRAEQKQLEIENAGTLKELCPLGRSGKEIVAGLRERQERLIALAGGAGYLRRAVSTAPFATGLGNEHPIENGFAFLSPYGLPYLAGSGVKGVLRRAAEELALEGDAEGWSWLDIWRLFGFEGAAGALWDSESDYGRAFAHDFSQLEQRGDLPAFIAVVTGSEGGAAEFLQRLVRDDAFRQSIHYRGALDFWDVFPAPKGDRLVVEIMTPHHTGYYQNGGTPHDAESPVPVPFLAVPAGSAFDFSVVCSADRLPPALRESWRAKLDAAFERAFDWLGFGAKTAVGYGAMETRKAAAESGRAVPGAARAAAATPAAEIVLEGARLRFNRGNGTLTAESGRQQAHALAPDGERLLATLPAEIQSKVRANAYVKVRAYVQGSTLLRVGIDG